MDLFVIMIILLMKLNTILHHCRSVGQVTNQEQQGRIRRQSNRGSDEECSASRDAAGQCELLQVVVGEEASQTLEM